MTPEQAKQVQDKLASLTPEQMAMLTKTSAKLQQGWQYIKVCCSSKLAVLYRCASSMLIASTWASPYMLLCGDVCLTSLARADGVQLVLWHAAPSDSLYACHHATAQRCL
eukprot:TRINITY_DN6965_c0_g1_i1.p4 TRINITY_DN6965_c0_g1~~TRINITY_DN6965_c0_g1_i1.p4  ORF type:complete len:110 (-),score=18.62 TRINITY_DN6965_c0_g1_i1:2346-2675(-)